MSTLTIQSPLYEVLTSHLGEFALFDDDVSMERRNEMADELGPAFDEYLKMDSDFNVKLNMMSEEERIQEELDLL